MKKIMTALLAAMVSVSALGAQATYARSNLGLVTTSADSNMATFGDGQALATERELANADYQTAAALPVALVIGGIIFLRFASIAACSDYINANSPLPWPGLPLCQLLP